MRGPVLQRFWSKVDKGGPIMPGMGTPCWLWTGTRDKDGYGRFAVDQDRGRGTRAHRFALEQAIGPLGRGQHALHHCDNPACVRYDHLFSGTNADNVADRQAKGRQSSVGPRNPVRGDRHHNAKLTSATAAELRRLYASGQTQVALARRFGIRQGTVSMVVLGKTWRTGIAA